LGECEITNRNIKGSTKKEEQKQQEQEQNKNRKKNVTNWMGNQ